MASKLQSLNALLPGVSRETHDRLDAYEALFHKWSRSFNLAAPSTLSDFWERHILDSAQLATIRRPENVWLDIGSGGGLPGIVMAILMRESQGGIVHLVESNGKKAAFLRQAIMHTGAAGVVHQMRIEDAFGKVPQPNVITARALASLIDLMKLTRGWMEGGATALFHKGRDFRAEIIEAGDAGPFDLIEHPGRIDPASAILEIRLPPEQTNSRSDAARNT